jgi:ABC-type multidrug transport system fused ATPase/permease subunit
VTRDPTAAYQELARRHAAERDSARNAANWLSNVRLVAFAATGLLIIWVFLANGPRTLGGVLAALSFVSFVALVRAHGRARERARWHARLHDVATLGLARVARNWSQLPERAMGDLARSHPYANDLDVVGHASLFTLLDTVSAFPGRQTLVRWLLQPTRNVAEIHERQAAARELVEKLELRQALHAHARAAGELDGASFQQFFEWAEGAPWLLVGANRVVYWLATLVPIATVGLFALAVAGTISGRASLVSFFAGIVLLLLFRPRLTVILDAAASRAIGLRQHAPMLSRLEQETFAEPLLTRLHDRIAGDASASAGLRRLDSALAIAEARNGGMGYAVLAAVALWDFQAVAALERWQRRAGRHVRDWIDALGEMESIAALASLAFENPTWCFPDVYEPTSSGTARVEGTSLGHPLLAPTTMVPNDVVVGPPGTILLVTGSNMSGKSTLLRAIGANAVLAQAGAPACALALRVPILRLWTSIRIQDSLERGLSLFMAELERVRDIVVASRESDSRPFLYLLDEILHGTNTAERQIAARTVLSHLTAAHAMGVVTTHDLALAETGDLSPVTRHVHFEETFVEDASGMRMAFDYRLREGVATSANAVKLLRMVGL